MRELIYEYYADKSEKKIMNDLVEMQWKIDVLVTELDKMGIDVYEIFEKYNKY